MIRKYADIFCWKNVRSLCSAKTTHIFSAKNIRILYIESPKSVNQMTLNELVKLTTLWTIGSSSMYCTSNIEHQGTSIKRNWYTFRGDKSVKYVSATSEKGLLLKEGICSHREKILSFRVDSFSEGNCSTGKETGSHNCLPWRKRLIYLPSVSNPLKGYKTFSGFVHVTSMRYLDVSK